MTDAQLLQHLIPHWYATRRWAEELLVRAFDLKDAAEILDPKHRGRRQIPGSNWFYRTHGLGVEITSARSGGIDFDFDSPHPDAWRLQDFAVKQLNAGHLPPEYQDVVRNKEALAVAVDLALAAIRE